VCAGPPPWACAGSLPERSNVHEVLTGRARPRVNGEDGIVFSAFGEAQHFAPDMAEQFAGPDIEDQAVDDVALSFPLSNAVDA